MHLHAGRQANRRLVLAAGYRERVRRCNRQARYIATVGTCEDEQVTDARGSAGYLGWHREDDAAVIRVLAGAGGDCACSGWSGESDSESKQSFFAKKDQKTFVYFPACTRRPVL